MPQTQDTSDKLVAEIRSVMAGEWTVNTLREYILALLNATDKRNEQRFQAQEAANTSALDAAKEAVGKAEHASEKRFDNTNEWRQAMNDRDLRLLPREEAAAKFKSQDEKIDILMKRVENSEGQGSGLHRGWGYLIGAVGLVGGLVAIVVALSRSGHV